MRQASWVRCDAKGWQAHSVRGEGIMRRTSSRCCVGEGRAGMASIWGGDKNKRTGHLGGVRGQNRGGGWRGLGWRGVLAERGVGGEGGRERGKRIRGQGSSEG
jgi:hypothetical protein